MLSFFAASQPFHQCNANSGLLFIYGLKFRGWLSSKAFLPSRYTAILAKWVFISDTLMLAFPWHMQDLYNLIPVWFRVWSFSRISSYRARSRSFLLRPYPSHSTKWLQMLDCLLNMGCGRGAGLPGRLVSPQRI